MRWYFDIVDVHGYAADGGYIDEYSSFYLIKAWHFGLRTEVDQGRAWFWAPQESTESRLCNLHHAVRRCGYPLLLWGEGDL